MTGYAQLGENGYEHIKQKQVIASNNEEMLPNVHRIAALLKRLLGLIKTIRVKICFRNTWMSSHFDTIDASPNSRGILIIQVDQWKTHRVLNF